MKQPNDKKREGAAATKDHHLVDMDRSLIASQLRRSVTERLAVHDRALTEALALRTARRVGDA